MMIRPWQITTFSLLMLIPPLFGVSISENFSLVIPIHRNNKINQLFSSVNSPGNIAICHAEGNCAKNGEFTSLYYGHIDPSKIGGKRILNQGFCSDYGKSEVGDIDAANRGCLRRMQSRLPRLTNIFQQQDIDVTEHKVAFVNSVDLWNQAAPRVSDNFPKLYAANVREGLSADNAIRKARVDSFNLKARGLFNICFREQYYINRLLNYPKHSTQWKRKCIDIDQNRRRLAIKRVLIKREVIN